MSAETDERKTAMTTDLPARVAELKPCPFCGGTDLDERFWASVDDHGPGCMTCGASAETNEKWNTRAALTGTEDAVLAVPLEIVAEAMDFCWNDHVADTHHCPPDFSVHRGKVSFQAGSWARYVGERINVLLRAKHDTPAAPTDGWIEWKGGQDCPVSSQARVFVRYRNGLHCGLPVKAGDMRWHHLNGGADIIAYKLAGEGGGDGRRDGK